MERQHILLEYDHYVKKYKGKYGENTIVLIQLGSFYELCSVTDKISYGEPNIHYICNTILNMAVAKKKYKDKDTYKDYYQGGFPIISYDKYIPLLLNKKYTIVFVEQITEKPEIKREVTNILSPGTDIKHKEESNYLLSIYIEKYNTIKGEYYIVGVSSIELSTGENYIHYINNEEKKYWSDEISRLIHFYNPSEIIFHTDNYDLTEDMIMNQWDINISTIRINHYTESYYKNITYQNEYLDKIFNLKMMVSPIDYFNLSHKKELINSYIYLLVYIEEHQPDILTNINNPKEYLSEDYLILNSNSIRQLNVVNNYSYYRGKNESLLEICNKCVTSMGTRLMKNRLLYPSISIETINKRYDNISKCVEKDRYKDIREYLRYISDIEKILRMMSINKLTPYELYSSYLSYEFVNKTCDWIINNDVFNIDKEQYSKYKEYYDDIANTFEFKNITNNVKSVEISIFKKGYDEQLDEISEENDYYIDLIEKMCDRFSNIIETNSSDKKLVKYMKDKDGHLTIYMTNARCTKLKQRLKNMSGANIHIKDESNTLLTLLSNDINFKRKDNSNMSLDIPIIKKVSNDLIVLQDRLNKRIVYLYEEFIKSRYIEYKECLKYINGYISDIDFYTTAAKISIDNSYCRPIVNEGDSFIDAKSLRHPIVEKINKDTEYVTNDICIKKGESGVLLYGTNACGKSTLMKSIGLNLIMAQAGLYVSASEFNYSIYTQIYTRILNNDNIFRSQSSFAIEIEELRTIERMADNRSLVLGDELCSGTETISALSIVSAGLYVLSKKEVSFIITTHLHQLNDIDIVKEIKNLKVYHLKINNRNGVIIYDRKLSEGSGPSVYGLNVCEALGVSKEFIDIAYDVQKKIQNKEKKVSNYNAEMILDECKICQKPAKETHHIKEQQSSDDNGIIEHYHKNSKHNLVQLCKSCHDSITYGNLVITGYKSTSEGKILNYHYSNDNKNTRNKYNEIQVNKMKEYRNIYDINISDCIKRIKLELDISISRQVLKKIMNNEY